MCSPIAHFTPQNVQFIAELVLDLMTQLSYFCICQFFLFLDCNPQLFKLVFKWVYNRRVMLELCQHEFLFVQSSHIPSAYIPKLVDFAALFLHFDNWFFKHIFYKALHSILKAHKIQICVYFCHLLHQMPRNELTFFLIHTFASLRITQLIKAHLRSVNNWISLWLFIRSSRTRLKQGFGTFESCSWFWFNLPFLAWIKRGIWIIFLAGRSWRTRSYFLIFCNLTGIYLVYTIFGNFNVFFLC